MDARPETGDGLAMMRLCPPRTQRQKDDRGSEHLNCIFELLHGVLEVMHLQLEAIHVLLEVPHLHLVAFC